MTTPVTRFSFLILLMIGLHGCQSLDTIDYSPVLSPELFLQQQHWMKVNVFGFEFIWSQPSSTVIVYFVGLFTMYVGYRFLKIHNHQHSLFWWGVGLLLTGLGALFAGTSYQALGYELKCNGRTTCTYTSWFEVFYMLLSVPGLNAFLWATSYTNAKGVFRKCMMAYALIHTLVYSALLLYGAFAPVRFLVSFDFFVLASAPTVLFLLLLHGAAVVKHHDVLNLTLLKGWMLFMCVGFAYGLYLYLGLTQPLWAKGIWFTENDVLHLGMTGWVYYLFKNLPVALKDSVLKANRGFG